MMDLDVKPDLHVFVCINDRSCRPGNTLPSCGPTLSSEDVKEVKMWLRSKGLGGRVFCTKTGCNGFCNPQGGVVIIYPQGRYVKGVKSVQDIKTLILEELEKLV